LHDSSSWSDISPEKNKKMIVATRTDEISLIKANYDQQRSLDMRTLFVVPEMMFEEGGGYQQRDVLVRCHSAVAATADVANSDFNNKIMSDNDDTNWPFTNNEIVPKNLFGSDEKDDVKDCEGITKLPKPYDAQCHGFQACFSSSSNSTSSLPCNDATTTSMKEKTISTSPSSSPTTANEELQFFVNLTRRSNGRASWDDVDDHSGSFACADGTEAVPTDQFMLSQPQLAMDDLDRDVVESEIVSESTVYEASQTFTESLCKEHHGECFHAFADKPSYVKEENEVHGSRTMASSAIYASTDTLIEAGRTALFGVIASRLTVIAASEDEPFTTISDLDLRPDCPQQPEQQILSESKNEENVMPDGLSIDRSIKLEVGVEDNFEQPAAAVAAPVDTHIPRSSIRSMTKPTQATTTKRVSFENDLSGQIRSDGVEPHLMSNTEVDAIGAGSVESFEKRAMAQFRVSAAKPYNGNNDETTTTEDTSKILLELDSFVLTEDIDESVDPQKQSSICSTSVCPISTPAMPGYATCMNAVSLSNCNTNSGSDHQSFPSFYRFTDLADLVTTTLQNILVPNENAPDSKVDVDVGTCVEIEAKDGDLVISYGIEDQQSSNDYHPSILDVLCNIQTYHLENCFNVGYRASAPAGAAEGSYPQISNSGISSFELLYAPPAKAFSEINETDVTEEHQAKLSILSHGLSNAQKAVDNFLITDVSYNDQVEQAIHDQGICCGDAFSTDQRYQGVINLCAGAMSGCLPSKEETMEKKSQIREPTLLFPWITTMNPPDGCLLTSDNTNDVSSSTHQGISVIGNDVSATNATYEPVELQRSPPLADPETSISFHTAETSGELQPPKSSTKSHSEQYQSDGVASDSSTSNSVGLVRDEQQSPVAMTSNAFNPPGVMGLWDAACEWLEGIDTLDDDSHTSASADESNTPTEQDKSSDAGATMEQSLDVESTVNAINFYVQNEQKWHDDEVVSNEASGSENTGNDDTDGSFTNSSCYESQSVSTSPGGMNEIEAENVLTITEETDIAIEVEAVESSVLFESYLSVEGNISLKKVKMD
jgi:hypothetical protein